MRPNMVAESGEKGNVQWQNEDDVGTAASLLLCGHGCFCAAPDGPQPHSPDQSAAGIDHPPIAGKFPARPGIGGIHARLGRDRAHAGAGLVYAKIHGRQSEAWLLQASEILRHWVWLRPPPRRG